MARFSEQFVQQVAQATDIVELVGQYVALKKRGRELVGLCPFHDDHKPSMYVSPAKQIFKCFACGAGGGVFQFVTLYEKVTFPEAVRMLAERARIPLPAASSAPAAAGGPGKVELAEVTAFAATFFRRALRSGDGAAARRYALGRGLSGESIERFGLGYAPPGWETLVGAARRAGIPDGRLIAAGLAVPRDRGGCYDRFRNRLMFPILDAAGKVIAFGGRALDEAERAKYLNSAESILFDKSASLYGLNWAREAIVSSGQVVVVEGYLDVLIPMQAGVGNVVATLGTALTERHVRLLSRYAGEAVLLFDADTAGAAATGRALELFLAQQIGVRVATIPAGKDPCEYVLAEGAEALKRLVAEAPDALQYAWSLRQEQWRRAGGNLAERNRAVEEFLRLVVNTSAFTAADEVRRGQLAQYIGHMLNVPAEALQQQMRRLGRRRRASGSATGPARSQSGRWLSDGPTALAERHVLEVLVNQPDMFDLAAERIDPADFADPALRRVAEAVWSMGQAGRLSLEDLLASEALADLGGLLTDLATEGEKRGAFEPTLHGAVGHILYRREVEDLRRARPQADSDEALRRYGQRLRSADMRRHPKIG